MSGWARRVIRVTATFTLVVIAGCGGGADNGATGTPISPGATTAPTTPATPACEPLGSLDEATSAQVGVDPLQMSALTGASMRVGRHDCYERVVFEMTGSGPAPGWHVRYVDQLVADGSGEVVELAGDATLEVVVRVWTVTDFAGRPPEWPPFTGPDRIQPEGYTALREVRNNFAFEGVTQLGIGLDQRRPFRVSWLDDPPRLVVDVATTAAAGG